MLLASTIIPETVRALLGPFVATLTLCLALLPALPPEHAHQDEAHHTRVVHRHFEPHDRTDEAAARASIKRDIVWLSPADADITWLGGSANPQRGPRAISPAALFVICVDGVPPSPEIAVSADGTPPPHGPPRFRSPLARVAAALRLNEI